MPNCGPSGGQLSPRFRCRQPAHFAARPSRNQSPLTRPPDTLSPSRAGGEGRGEGVKEPSQQCSKCTHVNMGFRGMGGQRTMIPQSICGLVGKPRRLKHASKSLYVDTSVFVGHGKADYGCLVWIQWVLVGLIYVQRASARETLEILGEFTRPAQLEDRPSPKR